VSKYMLALNRCPNHGTLSVSLDSGGGGVRLTSLRCCGRWDVVETWPMDLRSLKGAAEEIAAAVDDLDSGGGGE